MARMMAVAGVRVLELEGVRTAFGVPGVVINPFYAAMRPRNSIRRVLARHVEGASPMAEGYNSGYGEPGTGEVNHPFLFDVLDQDGYPG